MRFLIFAIGLLLPATASAQIVFSEIQWAGSPESTADEWLEIVNISDSIVSLAGWTIQKRDSDGGISVMISFPEDTEIGAGEYFVIANYDTDRSALSIAPDIVSTSVSLANTKLYLELLNTEGEVADSADDGSGTPFAGGKDPFASMERIDLSASGEDPDNWITATVSIGLDNDSVFGTPGSARMEEGAEDPEEPKEPEGSEETEEPEEPETSSSSSESSGSSGSSESLGSSEPFPQVRITEALANPTGSDDYEWIEIGNLGEEEVDITGWILSDGSRDFSIDSRTLKPSEHVIFFHYQTHITLTDSDVLTLFAGDTEIDRLPLSETGEQISLGRESDGSRGPFCIPTPRKPNTETALNPAIIVQSGRSTDYTKVTLNLNAEVTEGSLKDAECFWDFDDGTVSEKCNPPSHSWDYFGIYDVTLRVTTKCGEEIVRTKEVVVLEKKNPKVQKKQTYQRSSLSTSAPSVTSAPPVTSTSELSQNPKSSSSSKTISIEQKMYSSKSTAIQSKTPTELLPTRYRNVVASMPFSSQRSIYDFRPYRPAEPNSSESGLPWILLFSQSALWVMLAGKRLL